MNFLHLKLIKKTRKVQFTSLAGQLIKIKLKNIKRNTKIPVLESAENFPNSMFIKLSKLEAT